jgi:hypothetical protein
LEWLSNAAFQLLVALVVARTLADRRRRDEEVKQRISEKLAQSGEREKLKELLRHKLIECGWRDEMKAHCKGTVLYPIWLRGNQWVGLGGARDWKN